MAENNVYRIVLENKTEDSDKSKTSASNQSNDGTTENNTSKNKLKAVGVATYGYAKSVANRLTQSNINVVSLQTGYETVQRNQQLSYNMANRVISIGESIAMGAMLGNVGGALIGAVIGVSNQIIDVAIKQNEIAIAKQQEATQIFLNQIRMGAGQGRQGKE